LVVKGFIEKSGLETRRGRNRVCFRLTEPGKLVLDPTPCVDVKKDGTQNRTNQGLRLHLLTDDLYDSWMPYSREAGRLVDVNYPDRSATTILAGGSGE